MFGSVSVDLIGPMTSCYYQGQTVKHILIMVCLFSRYVLTAAIKYSPAECTIPAIVDMFVPVHGLFKNIRIVRGTTFTAMVFQGVMEELGVTATLIPPQNPNSNPVERQNQSVYAALRVDSRYPAKDWPKKLRLATFIINCAKS